MFQVYIASVPWVRKYGHTGAFIYCNLNDLCALRALFIHLDFVVCIFLSIYFLYSNYSSLCGKYLTKYKINITSCENNKNGSCPSLPLLNAFWKSLLRSRIMHCFQAIDSNIQLTIVKTKINAVSFSVIILHSKKLHILTKTIRESKCSYGVWHLPFTKSVRFCFSKCCVQIDTVNTLVKNINWLLVFLHSQFRYNSKSRKSKVKMQKITSLALGKDKC